MTGVAYHSGYFLWLVSTG